MCIDIFVPGLTIDIQFLLEQIWLRARKSDSNQLEVTEVYDLRIQNPSCNPPISAFWVLFPNDCTESKGGARAAAVEVWPVTPSAYDNEEIRAYEWGFTRPDWVDKDTRTTIKRGYIVDPPDPRGTNIREFQGKVLEAQVTFPGVLTATHQDLLAADNIKKTLICLNITPELKPGEEGWLRLKVVPTKLDQNGPRKSMGGSFPTFFSQRLTITCPLLVRDRLQMLLDQACAKEKAALRNKYESLRKIVFTDGVYKPGTGVRIADHRVAVIACDEVDVWDSSCTNAALYYGVIPLEGSEQTGLWWGCGSDRNLKYDLVHTATRVIDMCYYVGKPLENKEIARDLALSEKHEAFCTLLNKMIEVKLLAKHDEQGTQRVLLELPTDLQSFVRDERMVRLRQACAQRSVEGELLRSEFNDLHPFRIDYRAAWFGPP